MFTEEQLKQMREVMGEVVKPLDERLKNVEAVGLQTKTAVDALAEGQKDIRKGFVKELTNHERRLTELEDQAHTH